MTQQTFSGLNNRFKDAPWMTKNHPRILLAGLGGIGSNTMYCLYKTIPAVYFIIDMDNVEEHNVGTQFYKVSDLNKLKIHALKQNLIDFIGEQSDRVINPINNKIKSDVSTLPITIAAFDNMQARKDLFYSWKRLNNREIFIDGRLRAEYYQIFTVLPGREEDYEKTLFEDSEIGSDPCTFKQTAYFGMLIGARITHLLVNYLTNKALGEDINVVPFLVEEVGNLMYVKVE